MWLRDKVNNGTIEIGKVTGRMNRAGALTKPEDGSSLKHHLELTNQKLTKGRHEVAPTFSNTDPLIDTYGEGEGEQRG